MVPKFKHFIVGSKHAYRVTDDYNDATLYTLEEAADVATSIGSYENAAITPDASGKWLVIVGNG